MQYRKLGNSGTVVTSLCLGTMTFGWSTDEKTSFQIMDDYVAAGGNFFDMADIYSDGVSEEIAGRWFAARPMKARQIVTATKARFPMGGNGPNNLGLSRRHLSQALEGSLRRLGIDHIDLYQMHSWDEFTPVEETLRFLDDAIRAGKISYYGFSNYLGWQISKNSYLAKAHGWTLPVTLQSQYNLMVRDLEHEIIPACLDAGMGLLPYSPLAAGWLTGKYKRDTPPPRGTRVGEEPEKGMEAYDRRNRDLRTWQTLDCIAEISREINASEAQISLAWLLAQPVVNSVIIGCRTPAQLADNLLAGDVQLSSEQLSRLTAASLPRVEEYPYGKTGVWQRQRKLEGGY